MSVNPPLKRHLLLVVLLILLLSACRTASESTRTVKGTVSEFRTGKPVEQAWVKLSYVGWGQRDGDLVWDKQTIVETVTDSNGYFEASLPKQDVFVQVGGEEYVTYEGWHDAKKPIAVELQAFAPAGSSLRKDTLQLGFEQGSSYGWSFAEASSTFEVAEADLWPVWESDTGQLTIRALGRGGIAASQPKKWVLRKTYLSTPIWLRIQGTSILSR